jgi:hypothetical protein
MTWLLLVPAALQAAAMAVDEGWFHRRRGLPRWERLGHPIDTATVALAYGFLAAAAPSQTHAAIYAALVAASCLVITKDEWIHARACTPGEHWLHAVLFVLHPIAFAAFGVLWWTGHPGPVHAQLALTIAFAIYQLVYWRPSWRPTAR